jgi:hypothetical protein
MAKRAIKTIYAGIGLSALWLLGVKQPVVLGALVLGVDSVKQHGRSATTILAGQRV